MARTVLACIALGAIYGYVRVGEGSFFGFIIAYFVGALAGKVIHKIAGYKLGKKVVASIVAGLLIGMIITPLCGELYSAVATLADAPKDSTGLVTGILYMIGPAVVFVFGVLSPILYGYSRRS